MDVFNNYATSDAAEQNGRWFENGDVEFLIARSGNRKYNDMLSQLFTAHKHTLDQKDTPEARAASNACAEKLMTQVMASATLLGWRGKVQKDAAGVETVGKLTYKGEDLTSAYSAANAARLLAHRDFRAWVSEKSDSFRNFLEEVRKEDEKNSELTSSGNSPGATSSNS